MTDPGECRFGKTKKKKRKKKKEDVHMGKAIREKRDRDGGMEAM